MSHDFVARLDAFQTAVFDYGLTRGAIDFVQAGPQSPAMTCLRQLRENVDKLRAELIAYHQQCRDTDRCLSCGGIGCGSCDGSKS